MTCAHAEFKSKSETWSPAFIKNQNFLP